jgi:ABC-type phosphate transport system substrate-binding protein
MTEKPKNKNMGKKMNKISIRNIALLALAAIVAALALSACGGGSSTSASNDAVTESGSESEVVEAAFPSGHDTDEVSVTGAKAVKPCALVPKKKAESILGPGVRVSERPQGPTCVYMGSGREIDLVVEKTSLSSLKNEAKKVEPVTINGRQGYCLTYQSTSVVVGISGGRVLQVTGPCQAGVRFASIALKRL